MLKNYRIFISHSWIYDEYEKIIKFLEKSPRFRFTNYSVPVTKALDTETDSQLEQALYNRIKNSQVVLIPAGMEINYRYFIQFELEIAKQMLKPIIGIIPRGKERLPKLITDTDCKIVKWNSKSIVAAIREVTK